MSARNRRSARRAAREAARRAPDPANDGIGGRTRETSPAPARTTAVSGAVTTANAPAASGRLPAAIVVAALAAFGVAFYLAVERLAGVPLVCGPFGGCDVVQASPHALVGPVPVAVIGTIGSGTTLGLALAWWRRRDPRLLGALYVLGLAGLVVVAYLTVLELAVIRAVCSWCVGFAVLFGTMTALAAVGVRRA